LAEKLKIADGEKARKTSLESEIRALKEQIDKERKKSMVDEATIAKLEK
jgi:hypothetical protein